MTRHLKILEFALSTLLRHKLKNMAVVVVYTFVVFTLASVLFFSQALKKEANLLFDQTPELIVQRVSAGRHGWIPLSYSRTIANIRGVASVSPVIGATTTIRPPGPTTPLWGPTRCRLKFERCWRDPFFTRPDRRCCVVGQGVADARLLEPGDIIPVKGADGNLYVLRVKGVFQSSSQLLTNDLIVLPVADWREIFAIPADAATDLVTHIPNVT